jgi:putative oxidoreductase
MQYRGQADRIVHPTPPEVSMPVARLATRVVIGGLFIGHGTQKLFGWFDGPGMDGMTAGMEGMGMHPARANAYAAGITETTGGALLALGLATPLAAASLTGVMVTAIRKVHLANGVWASKGGYEYNVVLIAAVTAMTETGPGELSLDHLLGIEKKGVGWALAALALGAAASTATIELAKRQPVPAEEPGANEAAAPVTADES